MSKVPPTTVPVPTIVAMLPSAKKVDRLAGLAGALQLDRAAVDRLADQGRDDRRGRSTSTVNGCDVGMVGFDELVSIAVKVWIPSANVAVVVISKVSPEVTVPVPTIVVMLPSA